MRCEEIWSGVHVVTVQMRTNVCEGEQNRTESVQVSGLCVWLRTWTVGGMKLLLSFSVFHFREQKLFPDCSRESSPLFGVAEILLVLVQHARCRYFTGQETQCERFSRTDPFRKALPLLVLFPNQAEMFLVRILYGVGVNIPQHMSWKSFRHLR